MHGALFSREDYIRHECGGVPPQYPKRTDAAAKEMFDRGIMIDVAYLATLVRLGKVKPEKIGRENFYSAELIDAVMIEMAKHSQFTPLAFPLVTLRISAKQFCKEASRAFEQLHSEWGRDLVGERYDPNAFVWNIEPRYPAEAKLTLTPAPGTIARLEAIMNQQEQERKVERQPVA